MTHEASGAAAGVRIGAVTYLNAKPLVVALADVAPQAQVILDYPSRLADALAAGRLDVAMIPSIEYARGQADRGYSIISDACIACNGAVQSVKLFSRVPVNKIRTLALDEGSRTSATLVRILLKQRFGVAPTTAPLSLGASLGDSSADAILLIGDRGMVMPEEDFEFVWDLGEEWLRWTGLPFVFALWIARPDAELQGVAAILAAARDAGLERLPEIARQESPLIGLPEEHCLRYLRDHLTYRFGTPQRQAIERFYALAGQQGLAPQGVRLTFHDA
ncbi:MAG: menaquinone biosynthesis protein [Planctomycetaceae bacterium]|nr:menaquinone biosynthesis protein [Planctomycetaceae bacterium]